jgi:Flp pilus assembly protein TadD
MSPCPASAPRFVLAWLAAAFISQAALADTPEEVRALLARGDLPAALLKAQAGVASRPGEAQSRFVLGVVLMDMGRDAQALAVFTELSQAYPELPDPMNNIALLQARAGQLEPARQSLETALRNDPAHRAARVNLGQVHLMLAAQAWSQAVASMPTDSALLNKLHSVRALLAPPAR